jgi:hypothetical protein
MIGSICARLGIHPSQLLITWASPDCRTYSRADTSNIGRGNEYRNHKLDAHPPKDTIDDKRMTAIQHDLLLHSLLESFWITRALDPEACFVMENLSASLRRRTFVKVYESLLHLTCHLVHYCAFLAKVKKPTDIWTNFNWTPRGTTGDGLCRRKCAMGHSVRTNGRLSFRHPEAVGSDPALAPKGFLAAARLPPLLHEEILDAALAQHSQSQQGQKRTYVLELFAGSTRLGLAARKRGLSYIAVDISAGSARCFQQLHGHLDN